jgi:hypothetical protein
MEKMEKSTDESESKPTQKIWLGPSIVALIAFFGVIFTLDPDQCCDYSASGPGITIDESFNVEMGVYLVECVKAYGIGLLDPETQREVFSKDQYLPDHPPLGRLWLGIWHSIGESIAPAKVDGLFVTASARWGSAAAFAFTILLIGLFTGYRFGKTAGIISAISLLLMPRLFAHAHLAALDTVTNLFWTASVLAVAHWWYRESSDGPTTRTAALTGVLLGFALLTKIQAIIIPPVVICWAVWHWRLKAIRPLVAWTATGFAVFCIGWPYLWFDFIPRITEYFASSSDRAVVNVWYFGEKLADKDAAWHYPWVMFLVTVPVGLLLLGNVGVFRQRCELLKSPSIGLVFGAVIAPLVLFSIPGVAVYDGVRLFLVSFPVFCVFIGIGFQSFVSWLHARTKRPNLIAYAIIGCQVIGLVWMHPFQLSYYNGLVGGTAGAARLGFEVSYWGDSISSELIEQLESNNSTEILVAPQMHQFQVDVLAHQCLRLGQLRMTTLSPLDPQGASPQRLLLFHRRADMPTELELTEAGWSQVGSCVRQGIELASIWSRDQ